MTIAEAVQRATDRPLQIEPPPGPKTHTLAAAAAYLSEANGGQPFPLGGTDVAVAMGWPPGTAFAFLGDIARRGVIAWDKPSSRSRPRTAKFTGRVVGEEAW